MDSVRNQFWKSGLFYSVLMLDSPQNDTKLEKELFFFSFPFALFSKKFTYNDSN